MDLNSLIFYLFLTNTLISQSNAYFFSSGFEGNTTIHQYYLNGNYNRNYADITGFDNGYDWELDLDDSDLIGNFRINYEQGDTSKSIATIINEPGNERNTVLKFHILEPHIDYENSDGELVQKGRIQATINNSPEFHRFHSRVRLFIPKEFDTLKSTPKEIRWLTLKEYWNNEPFQEYPFRVTFNIQKAEGIDSELYFGVHGQTKEDENGRGECTSVWEDVNKNYPLPTGEWITLKTTFIEGDSILGNYSVTIIDSLFGNIELFNIIGFTHHPDDNDPDGITSFNPMKLYTSGELISGMNDVSSDLFVYWDDFKIWTIMLGDINGDAVLNVLDIISIVDTILAGEYISIGDLNEDGYLNVGDVVILVNVILGNHYE